MLDKAARLQHEQPDRLFVPLLVCRRAHLTAHRMAKNLGFYIIQSRTNFLRPSADVDPADVETVRQVLGFADLLVVEEPGVHLKRQFEKFLPAQAAAVAAQWKSSAPVIAELVYTLRQPGIPSAGRAGIMDHLRETAFDVPFGGTKGGW